MSTDEERLSRERKLMREYVNLSQKPMPDYGSLKRRVEDQKRARRAEKQARRKAS